MVKVALWYDRPQEYSGGLNYMRNLLFALSCLENKMIQPYIFFGKRVDASTVSTFEGLATVVRSSILDRKSPAWFLHQILHRIFGSQLMVYIVIRRHGISIISHANQVFNRPRPFRVISWIPDFQYLHLPELFPYDTAAESKRLRMIADRSDALILSSQAAAEDYRRIAGSVKAARATVLQFVSQPSGTIQNVANQPTMATIEAKYGFQGRFFLLPNQFWQHKNHSVAFKAVKILKERDVNVLLLCTGNLQDYRLKDNTAYIDGFRQFIKINDLSLNIRILGMIDYNDVLFMMRSCVAVINPSRFEGWSSTVEEGKSMGKQLILSNIPVHREQDPPGAIYFEPDDEQLLAEAMSIHWENLSDAISEKNTQMASQDLQQRTIAYAEGYSHLVLTLNRQIALTK
jgi:glycosyltransferase involved in cell wall biosynthesis